MFHITSKSVTINLQLRVKSKIGYGNNLNDKENDETNTKIGTHG